MANRRMISLEVVDSDAFLDMPVSSQALYFHLNCHADDDGFISNPKKIARLIGVNEDDIKVLFMKKFLIAFNSGVCVIKHWRINNFIRKDIYRETNYLNLKKMLYIRPNGAYSLHEGDNAVAIPEGHFQVEKLFVNDTLTERQLRIGKDRIGKVSKTKRLSEEQEKQFETWWSEYPRKVAKKKCLDWWIKHQPNEEVVKKLSSSVASYKLSKQWKEGYIPHPYTFLFQERFNDEPEADTTNKPQFKSYNK